MYYPWVPAPYWTQPVHLPLYPAGPMVGGETARPLVSRPRVLTRTLAEGTARACPTAGDFRYRRGERVEVLRVQRTRQGLFYLVMTPAGCVGWVPAAHVAVRRGAGGDEDTLVQVAWFDDDETEADMSGAEA